MSDLIFVKNPNIEVVDQFTFKCIHCGHEFNICDVERKCLKCSNELFPKMFKQQFTRIFADVIESFTIDDMKVRRFFEKRNIRLRSLGICNKLSTIIDMNLEIQFGGQYKSFTVDESYQTILNNNFHAGD